MERTVESPVWWKGSDDGKFRAYGSATGKVLWSYGGGAVIANGMVYVDSAYHPEYSTSQGRAAGLRSLTDPHRGDRSGWCSAGHCRVG